MSAKNFVSSKNLASTAARWKLRGVDASMNKAAAEAEAAAEQKACDHTAYTRLHALPHTGHTHSPTPHQAPSLLSDARPHSPLISLTHVHVHALLQCPAPSYHTDTSSVITAPSYGRRAI
jgi:hypothetical protein